MSRSQRDREINRRRKRKLQLAKFLGRYMKASASADKQAIVEKIRRISPFFNVEERAAAKQTAE